MRIKTNTTSEKDRIECKLSTRESVQSIKLDVFRSLIIIEIVEKKKTKFLINYNKNYLDTNCLVFNTISKLISVCCSSNEPPRGQLL